MRENRDFDEWLSKFRKSISTFNYYIDFPKVYNNVDILKVRLNILNSLIGSKNIESDFIKLISQYPEVLECIPILLAIRNNEIYAQDMSGSKTYEFKKYGNISESPNTIEDYTKFMKNTGLFDLISNHLINNLVDYVLGVETGLDSNGRKNRGGHQMENLVETFIIQAGFIINESYFKEMYLSDIEKKWGVNLNSISNKGKTKKRFDFVVKTDDNIYAIETNFYASNGSKLNETARSYKMIAKEAEEINGFKFIWITDGVGWFNAKNNLRETFEVMDTIYNIQDLECGAFENLE